jgi:hypothetical protein
VCRLAKGKLRLTGPQRAAAGETNEAQHILQLQHLVFFSYSWPCLCVLWPPAISQDPVAKSVYIRCSGFSTAPGQGSIWPSAPLTDQCRLLHLQREQCHSQRPQGLSHSMMLMSSRCAMCGEKLPSLPRTQNSPWLGQSKNRGAQLLWSCPLSSQESPHKPDS